MYRCCLDLKFALIKKKEEEEEAVIQHQNIVFLSYYLRSWSNIYFVLKPGQLSAYKDAKSFAHSVTYHGENPLPLHNAVCEVLTNYKKKKHVFKLR